MYNAAIHSDSESISIGISNPRTGDILSVSRFETNIKSETERVLSVLKNEPNNSTLINSSKNVYYSLTPNFTFIPSVFYDANNFEKLVQPLLKVEEPDTLLKTFIPEIDSFLAFTMNLELINSLKSTFGHIFFRHHFASLISAYHLFYAKEGHYYAFIQYHNKQFTLCLMHGKKMVSFNVFEVRSYEDVIYYTYFSMEQFEFPTSETHIHIGGNYAYSKEVLTAFQRYSPHIFHLKPSCCSELEKETANALINTIFDVQCG